MTTKEIHWQIDEPIPFQGTPEEARANFETHLFGGSEGRCYRCDAKTWHKAAEYQCGDEPPRRLTTYFTDGTVEYQPYD